MGTYPTLPAYILSSGQDLQEYINEHPKLMGDNVINKFGKNLPFLPKVLSIAKALTLQVHPGKALAGKLHQQNPKQFTDDNHKPEIAVAMTDFEAFCGWKPLPEIQDLFQKVTPLQKYMPQQQAHFDIETVKRVVLSILKDSEDNIEKIEEQIKQQPLTAFGKSDHIPKLLPRLQEQYGKRDPGTLVALFMMNYLQLKPGQACFIPADGIHAYLSGDIVECMARSNNVLNAAFCPPDARDSPDLFISTLGPRPHSPEDAMLPSKPYEKSVNGKTIVYEPDMEEFNMLYTKLESKNTEELKAIEGPSILFSTKGAGIMKARGKTVDLKEGYIFFVGAGESTTFETKEDGLEIWRAYVE